MVAGKTAKSILISCGARLAPFDIKELRELMETDEMELDTIGDRKTALFVIISDTDDTFNFVVSILYTQLFNLLCDKADDEYGGRLPVHVRCLLDEFANIGQIPFIKGPNVPGNGAAQKVNKRQNEPHSCNAFLLAKLTLIKGKFLLAASEKHLNAPSVCIEGKNLLCREFCTGRDKYAECFSFPKGIFRIAQQHDSIIMAIDLSLIPVYIVVPFAPQQLAALDEHAALWVGHDIGAVALHQVWQHEEPRLAAAGTADDQNVLVARVLWILRAALHRQKLRRCEDHVAAEFGVHVSQYAWNSCLYQTKQLRKQPHKEIQGTDRPRRKHGILPAQ